MRYTRRNTSLIGVSGKDDGWVLASRKAERCRRCVGPFAISAVQTPKVRKRLPIAYRKPGRRKVCSKPSIYQPDANFSAPMRRFAASSSVRLMAAARHDAATGRKLSGYPPHSLKGASQTSDATREA